MGDWHEEQGSAIAAVVRIGQRPGRVENPPLRVRVASFPV